MNYKTLLEKSRVYLEKLCNEIPQRCVGSEGNRQATRFFQQTVESWDWESDGREFDAIDWEDGGASLQTKDAGFEVLVSPYSPGCRAEAALVSVSCLAELQQMDFRGKILLLHGDIASEQFMPKNFVFYNPDAHQRIIFLLEQGGPGYPLCYRAQCRSCRGSLSLPPD